MRSWLLAATALFLGCGAAAVPARDAAAPADAAVTLPLDAAVVPDAQGRPTNPTCNPPPQPVPAGLAGLLGRLGETGCFDPADPTRPLSALIPYQVNAPLWSDGAEKDRWRALPDGARIQVGADGDFNLPLGTVLIKTFRLGQRRVETLLRPTSGG